MVDVSCKGPASGTGNERTVSAPGSLKVPLLSTYSEKVGGGFATWMVPTCQRHRASIFMWQLEVAGLRLSGMKV